MGQLTKDQMVVVLHTSSLDEFLERRINALSVYTTDELFILNQRGIAVHVFQPRAGSNMEWVEQLMIGLFKNVENVIRNGDKIYNEFSVVLNGELV